MGRWGRLSRLRASRRLSTLLQLVAAGAIVAAAIVTLRLREAPVAHEVRERLLMFTPTRALETAAAVVEVLVILWLVSAIPAGRRAAGRVREVAVRALGLVARTPALVALTAIVTAAAGFRILLTRAETIPHFFGDELFYTDLAKSIALHGEPLVRGHRDIGHSVLYPLLISPVYGLASDGAASYVAVKTLNAVAFSLTAIPTYFLARRVVSHGWSLCASALVVIAPWTAYAAFTMTESLFLPAFTAFAVLLVRMLERPTAARQLSVLVGLGVLVGIRPQALVLAASVVAAIAVSGFLAGGIRPALEQHAIVLAGIVLAGAAGLIALPVGLSLPAGSAGDLFTLRYDPLVLIKWTLWNLAVYELAVGVIALAAFPLALRGLLRRSASQAAREVGAVALTLSAGILLSVVVLSANRRWGGGILHERNLFYVTPLVLICLAHWLAHGLVRPKRLAAATAAAVCVLPAVLSDHVVAITNNVDSPTSAWLQQLKAQEPGTPLKAWTIGIAVAAVVGMLLMRRPLTAVVSVVLAFVAIASPLDYSGPFTPDQDHALAWVDHSLPAGATATLIHVGLSNSDQPCADAADYEQRGFVIWTEFFNTKVDRVMHVLEPVTPGLLASDQLKETQSGSILRNGRTLSTPYVVLDSRQPIVGRRITRFDLPSLRASPQEGASLSLWKSEPPLRFLPPAEPLPPRANGAAC